MLYHYSQALVIKQVLKEIHPGSVTYQIASTINFLGLTNGCDCFLQGSRGGRQIKSGMGSDVQVCFMKKMQSPNKEWVEEAGALVRLHLAGAD